MEGLTNLLSALSDISTPTLEFIVWIFPIKVYRLDDGDKGVIVTWGCVRNWRTSQRGPGVHFCFMFEEMIVVQAIGGYVNLSEQTLITKDKKIWVVNGAIQYSILNVKEAILETEDIEDLIEGICMNEIREHARLKDSMELLDSDKLTQGLAKKMNYRIKKHGTKIERIMLTDFRPHVVTAICDTVLKIFPEIT